MRRRYFSFIIFIIQPIPSTAGHRPPSVFSNIVYSGPIVSDSFHIFDPSDWWMSSVSETQFHNSSCISIILCSC